MSTRGRSFAQWRNASRILRFARFRSTAEPYLRDTTIPSRGPHSLGNTCSERHIPVEARPSRNTRRISPCLLSRIVTGKRPSLPQDIDGL